MAIILNTPQVAEIIAITSLVHIILQPLRSKFGPIKINSGFRCLELNTAIGSSKTSDHIKGYAADIECPSIANLELAKYISKNFNFKQLIAEFVTKQDPTDGWIHISFDHTDANNKKQCLHTEKVKGKLRYVAGLYK